MECSKVLLKKELLEKLDDIAQKERVQSEELLESVVVQFLANYDENNGLIIQERRCAPRLRASVQAVVCVKEREGGTTLYQSVVIEDVSPDGFLINCRKGKLVGCVSGEYTTGFVFDVLVDVKDSVPIQFQCKATRIELVGEVLYIGSLVTTNSPENKNCYDIFYQQLTT